MTGSSAATNSPSTPAHRPCGLACSIAFDGIGMHWAGYATQFQFPRPYLLGLISVLLPLSASIGALGAHVRGHARPRRAAQSLRRKTQEPYEPSKSKNMQGGNVCRSEPAAQDPATVHGEILLHLDLKRPPNLHNYVINIIHIFKNLWAYGRGTKATGKEGYRSYNAPGAVLSSRITFLSLHYHISSHRIISYLISSHLILSHHISSCPTFSFVILFCYYLLSADIFYHISSYLILSYLILS